MMHQPDARRTYAESLQSATRFFAEFDRGGFRFAVTNDEVVQRRFNTELQWLLRGKGKPLLIHDWSKASPPDMYPAEQLRRLLVAHPDAMGIVCIGLETALQANPELLTQLNFAREALADLGVPLLFWLSFRTLPDMGYQAIDLYNQRAGANLYFEHVAEFEDADHRAARYVAHETIQANREIQALEARLRLIERQFDEAKAQSEPPERLANGIVLELLKLYVQVPGTVNLVKHLIDTYASLIDPDNPESCATLAESYTSLGDPIEAERLWTHALTQYREFASVNPQTYLPNVAGTLNNLANLQRSLNDYESAEKGYQEALKIRRELAQTNPQTYLPDVAMTLINMGLLYQRGLPDRSKSLCCVHEAMMMLRPFLDRRLLFAGKYRDVARQVVSAWGLDPDDFFTSGDLTREHMQL